MVARLGDLGKDVSKVCLWQKRRRISDYVSFNFFDPNVYYHNMRKESR